MSDPFGGEMRDLPYPLDEAVSLEAETPEASGTIVMPDFPEDSDERISILHRWSLNEFVAMATCLDVGSDLAYGSQAIRMWWIWSSSMVSLCEEIAACIEETEAVRNALAQWFSDAVDTDTIVQQALERAFDASKPGSEVPESYAAQNQYGAALGCDNDDGWGHIRNGLVDRSFDRVLQVLEEIEAVTNNQEMLAQFLNAIPAVGAFFDVIPVTDWVLWFDNVRAWMKEQFEAGDSTELRDAIACDLFCIWQVDCTLSFDQIRQYYWEKTVELVPLWSGAFDSMSALATALGVLSSTSFGSPIVYALVGSQYGFMTFVNSWFGVHVNVIGNDLALGEPSDDWTVLCDDCPDPCIEPIFTVINPGGTVPGGTVDVTDNLDGTWTVVGTSALDGDNRLLFCDLNCCWNVVSVVYSAVPENLNSHYTCGAQPTDSDIGNGAAGNPDPVVVDICIAGVLAASVSTAFTVTIVIEACP